MIAADVSELDARLKQMTLQIRDKELSLFASNLAVLGTKSAFLCGLGWSGLTMARGRRRPGALWRRRVAGPAVRVCT